MYQKGQKFKTTRPIKADNIHPGNILPGGTIVEVVSIDGDVYTVKDVATGNIIEARIPEEYLHEL